MLKKIMICVILLLSGCSKSIHYELGEMYDFQTIRDQGFENQLSVSEVS